MATLSQIPRLRPGLPSFLRLSLLGPILVSASAMHAQATCGASIILAGQSCLVTVPPSHYGYLSGSCVGWAITNGSYGSFVAGPLAAGDCDAHLVPLGGNPSDRTAIVSFPVFPANGISPQSLIGQYAFQLSGKTTGGQAESRPVAAAGSFAADGNGNITSGVIDINSPAGIVVGESVTGTYQVSVVGAGIMYLATSQGTLQFTLASLPLSPIGNTQYVNSSGGSSGYPSSLPMVQGGTIATTAGGFVSASGTFMQLERQNGNQFHLTEPATLNGNFFVNLSGQWRDGAALAEAARLQFAAANTVTADLTLAGNGTLTKLRGWTGTYRPFDPDTGRSVLTLTDPAQPNAAPQVFSVYEINQGQTLYLVSTAPSLLTGRADQQ